MAIENNALPPEPEQSAPEQPVSNQPNGGLTESEVGQELAVPNQAGVTATPSQPGFEPYSAIRENAPVRSTTQYFSQRSNPFIIGTPENTQLLTDARTSDKVTSFNIQMAIKQRKNFLALERETRQMMTGDPRAYPISTPAKQVPFEDQARVLTALGNTEDEIQTNLYYEQERTDEEAEFYFTQIKPKLIALQDKGINIGTLTRTEIADLIKATGGLADEQSYARFADDSWNTPGSRRLGVSSWFKLKAKLNQLDPMFVRGEYIDSQFMSGQMTWDYTNETHRQAFADWTAYKTVTNADAMIGFQRGFGGVFTMYLDLFIGIGNGTINPDQYINPEWLADPDKKKEVMEVLQKASTISPTARQILGLSDDRSETEILFGVERKGSEMLIDPDVVYGEIATGPGNAEIMGQLKSLIDRGALKGSRWRVLTSNLDGAMQGIAGLAFLPLGGGFNPDGYFNSSITSTVNLLNYGTRDWESSKLTTQMKWANLARDSANLQHDWLANGYVFNDPAYYSKLGGGAGGQGIDPLLAFGSLAKAGKLMRYGATAAARVAHATETAGKISAIGRAGFSIAEIDKAAGVESYLGKVVRQVQEEAAKAGEAITETEAVQRALSGKVSFNGIPLTAKELDVLASQVEMWTEGVTGSMRQIDQIVAEARKLVPDGINMTNEQIMEYLANNNLPTGAGKSLYNVYDSLDARAKAWFIAKMKSAGPAGQQLLEQLRLASPEKGAMYGLQRGISATLRVGAVGAGAGFAWSTYGVGGLGAAAASAAIGWRYWLPDALMIVGYAGDRIAVMEEFYKASTEGKTLYGSTWLHIYKEKMKEAAGFLAKAQQFEKFPVEAAKWRSKANEAQKMATSAKIMHAWWSPSAVPTAALNAANEAAISGTIQDFALSFVNEDLRGMGFGGVVGNAVWNKGYHSLIKTNALGNNDQLFAKQMIELREIYSKKPDHQRAALIRVLTRAQEQGNVREIVSGLVGAHVKGVDVSLMKGGQASAVVRAAYEGVPGPDGRIDTGKTIDYLMKYGLSETEASDYVTLLQRNSDNRRVLETSIHGYRTKGDELLAKADARATALIARTEKLNAAGTAMEASKQGLLQVQQEAKAVQLEWQTARDKGIMTPELDARFKDTQKKLSAAQRDFDIKTGILRRTKEIVESEKVEISAFRAEAAQLHASADEVQAKLTPRQHYVGQTVVAADGSLGRMIAGGVYIFDKENGRRHIILDEETFTRADALEEAFHAAEDDAVIQELRTEAVRHLFGVFGRDEEGNVVQIQPGSFNKADADNFMSLYAQGLPTPEIAAAFMHEYEIAYKHYQQTGDASFLYRQVSEIMARQFVGREISLGLYATRGAGTPSTPTGALEGAPTTAGGVLSVKGTGKAIFKLVWGDATIRDYADAGFTNAAEAYGLLGRGGLFEAMFNRQKVDYLERSGAQISYTTGGVWSAGYLFDKNGNRVKEPIFDSYIDAFNRRMRGSTGELAKLASESYDDVLKLDPESQVAWAAANNRRHWIGKDGKLKPLAQITAEYSKAVDSVFIEFEKRAKAGQIGMSINIDDKGTRRITLSPRGANADDIMSVLRNSDMPVGIKRQVIEVIAGIAGGDILNPSAEHPGMLPGYSFVYNPVTSKGLPDPKQRQVRRFMPYSISIEQSYVGLKGEKLDAPRTNVYFNTIDLKEQNLRPDMLWTGNLVDEDGVAFFTPEQVKAIFPGGRPDIMRHFEVYLANLSGAVSPELVEAARNRGRYEPPARSWELFDSSNGSDANSVARAKIIAEMMYRMLGTRPTKKMRGLAPGATKRDLSKAEKLMDNAEDMSDDPFERLTAQDVSLGQGGIFRQIRVDRIESLVNLKSPFANKAAMFPFSSQAYELSQIAHSVKQSWERVNEWETETTSYGGAPWFQNAPKAFRQRYSDKIKEGFKHPSGYFVFKTNSSKHWMVANTSTGEVIGQGILTPQDGFVLASNHAMQTVQKPQNALEVQMKQAGFFPRGLSDKANGFRSVYQNKEGMVLERKGSSSSRRFELRDKFGNVVSSNILMAVNADIVDVSQLEAAARIAKTNGQVIIGLQKKLPGMPSNFPMFYDLVDTASGAQMKGIVGGRNPKFQQIRSVLLETLGPKNAEFVLGTMVQELGHEVVHSDQTAVMNWTANFFGKRVNEDMKGRLRSNFPKDKPELPDWSRDMGTLLFNLEEASLYSSDNPKKPNRAVLLSRAEPERIEAFARRVEEESLEASQATELAAQIKQRDKDTELRMQEWLKNAQARDKALARAKKTQDAADIAEAEALGKRNQFLELLNEQDADTKTKLVERLQGLLEQEGSADWKGQDTIYQAAVSAIRDIKRQNKSEKTRAQKKFNEMEAKERQEALIEEAETRQRIADHYKMLADKEKAEIQARAKAEEQAQKDAEMQERQRAQNQRSDVKAALDAAKHDKRYREQRERAAAEQARQLLSDGVMSDLIARAGVSVNDFDAAMASVAQTLEQLKLDIANRPTQTALDLNAVNRAVVGQNLGKALLKLRELETATVNSIVGNEFGWKIAEVAITETQPKTAGGRAARHLLSTIVQRGYEVDLTPALTAPRESGAPLFGWTPDQGTGRQIVQQAFGSVANIPHDVSRILRRKYVVYNPSNVIVGVYETKEQAAEAAAEIHSKRKK